MGFKLSAVLALVIITMGGAFKLYYDKSEAQKEAMATQLQQAMNNQELLESTISTQNTRIEEQLQKQQESQARISELSTANSKAMEEVTELRGKFARHDLNMLSMTKPGLLEKMINRGTKRVGEDLERISDPHQFDEDNTTNTSVTQ
jgi:DNA repair exonuclease SbcCD ATPase subunit